MSPQAFKHYKQTKKDMAKFSQEFQRDLIEDNVPSSQLQEQHSVVEKMTQIAARDIKEQKKSIPQATANSDDEEVIVQAGPDCHPILICMPTLKVQSMLIRVDSKTAQEFIAWSTERKVDVVHLPGYSSVTQSSISAENIDFQGAERSADADNSKASSSNVPISIGCAENPDAQDGILVQDDKRSDLSESTHPQSSTSAGLHTSTDLDSQQELIAPVASPTFGQKRAASELSITDESLLLRDPTDEDICSRSAKRKVSHEALNYSMDTQAGQSLAFEQKRSIADTDDSLSSVDNVQPAIATSSPSAIVQTQTSGPSEEPAGATGHTLAPIVPGTSTGLLGSDDQATITA